MRRILGAVLVVVVMMIALAVPASADKPVEIDLAGSTFSTACMFDLYVVEGTRTIHNAGPWTRESVRATFEDADGNRYQYNEDNSDIQFRDTRFVYARNTLTNLSNGYTQVVSYTLGMVRGHILWEDFRQQC